MGTSFLESNKFSTTVSISASVLSIKMDSFNLYASLVTNYSFFLINSESNFIDFSTSHGLGFLHVSLLPVGFWLLTHLIWLSDSIIYCSTIKVYYIKSRIRSKLLKSRNLQSCADNSKSRVFR